MKYDGRCVLASLHQAVFGPLHSITLNIGEARMNLSHAPADNKNHPAMNAGFAGTSDRTDEHSIRRPQWMRMTRWLQVGVALAACAFALEVNAAPVTSRFFWVSTPPANHPEGSVQVPLGFKLIGGGAYVRWSGAGNMLTSTFPHSNLPNDATFLGGGVQRDVQLLNGWAASAQDNAMADPSPLDLFAIAIQDPDNAWVLSEQVVLSSSTADEASGMLLAFARLSPGAVVVGGGCRMLDPNNLGVFLVSSYPRVDGWECAARSLHVSSQGRLAAYVIRAQPRVAGTFLPHVHIDYIESATDAHPHVAVQASKPGWVLTAGGASTNLQYGGQFLTATLPAHDAAGNLTGWNVASKDHLDPSPSKITAYALSVDFNHLDTYCAPNGAPMALFTVPKSCLGKPPMGVAIQGCSLTDAMNRQPPGPGCSYLPPMAPAVAPAPPAGMGAFVTQTGGLNPGRTPAPQGPCPGGTPYQTFPVTQTCTAGGTNTSTPYSIDGCSLADATAKHPPMPGCIYR